MGIGTDLVKQLQAQVAALPVSEQRAAFAELVDAGNARLLAVDLGEVDAKHVFAESKPQEFEIVRTAEVAKKLAEIDKPKEVAAENIDGALAAEVEKR